MNSLVIHNLTVSYHQNTVLEDINLVVPENKLTGIIGPNGAGKSTLLKAIMGLLPISKGDILIGGKTLKNNRQAIAYIPQKDAVDWDFPATVMDVVLMGRYGKKSLFKSLNKEDKTIAISCLQKVDLLNFSERPISALSGGQKQRVFIARALAQEADIYFMDEPFAGVDAASEKQIMAILLEMQKQGKSIFVVHHDLHSANNYFDWIVLLNVSIIANGAIKETFTQENLQKAYLGKLSINKQL